MKDHFTSIMRCGIITSILIIISITPSYAQYYLNVFHREGAVKHYSIDSIDSLSVKSIIDSISNTPAHSGYYLRVFYKDNSGSPDILLTEIDSMNIADNPAYEQIHEFRIIPTDIIGSYYSWLKDFGENKQSFLYPHILVSYINSEWYDTGNLEYVIIDEIPLNRECESIGSQENYASYYKDAHATAGYDNIRRITPTATIKCNILFDSGYEHSIEDLEKYLEENPQKNLMLSSAVEDGTPGEMIKKIISNDNVIFCCASGNIQDGNAHAVRVINENVKAKSINRLFNLYTIEKATFNGSLNNKITVTGYNPNNPNLFGDSGDSDSALPVGFGKGDIVMPMSQNSTEDDTHSSFSTASLSSTLGNFLSILMKNYPGTSLERANTILQQNYLKAEKMRYLDYDVMHEGGDWYFFDIDKFILNEILHKPEIDDAISLIENPYLELSRDVELPSTDGLCYIGPGIQFEIDGIRYDMAEQNRSIIEQTLKNTVGNEYPIKWFFSPSRVTDFGLTGPINVTVSILDHEALLIPNIFYTITL